MRWFDGQAEAVERYLKITGLFGLIDPASPAAQSGVRHANGRYRLASDPLINAAVGPEVAWLIGAAHAGCFSMALSLMLCEAGLTPEKIETHADVTLEKVGAGFEITAGHLTVSAKIPGTDNSTFQEIANKAKSGCPVSKLLRRGSRRRRNLKLERKLRSEVRGDVRQRTDAPWYRTYCSGPRQDVPFKLKGPRGA